jgi:hypothetical protein
MKPGVSAGFYGSAEVDVGASVKIPAAGGATIIAVVASPLSD